MSSYCIEEHLSPYYVINTLHNYKALRECTYPPSDFYARQHICYSAYMPWQFRLSVRLSVTRVDQSKTIEARITQFSPYSSPIPLVFRE